MVSTTEMAKELVEAMEAATIVAKRIYGGIKQFFHFSDFLFFLKYSHIQTQKHKK